MTLRPHLNRLRLFSLSLLLASPVAFADTADDFFHAGAVYYLSNNIPKALEVVSNGLASFPDDIKLKKLEELLKPQQQQPQQQPEDQQSKQDQQPEQQKNDEEKKQADKKEQEQKQDQQPARPNEKSEEKPDEKQQPMAAHAMTPQEARQLLDAQKADEKVLQFAPEGPARSPGRVLKDW
jgi:outer membrane biosynthesis protein TonB